MTNQEKTMKKVVDFRSVLSMLDFIITALIVIITAYNCYQGIQTGNPQGLAIVGMALIICLIGFLLKVLVFGIAYSVVAIALNTVPEKKPKRLKSYEEKLDAKYSKLNS